MRKRIADWMEKISVGSLLVGIYQEKTMGLVVAGSALAICLTLTWMEAKR